MSIVMYGMGPTDVWPPIPEPTVPRRVLPDATLPWFPPATGAGEIGRAVLVGPTAPEDASAVTKRLDERIAWLENELRMHESWKAELALLRKMRAATTDEKGTER